MPLRIGLVLVPFIPMAMVLMRRGPVSKFYRAGAISPETARRPASVQAVGDLQSALRGGVLKDIGDGRYFVDVDAYRKRQRVFKVGIAALIALVAIMLVLAWAPWR